MTYGKTIYGGAEGVYQVAVRYKCEEGMRFLLETAVELVAAVVGRKKYPIEEKMYIPDLPNTIITIKEYGKRKTVIDNHNAPKELKDFELFLLEKFKEVEFGMKERR